MAPIEAWCSGTTNSPSASSNTSRSALTMPALAATPPWNTTGASSGRPRARLLRMLRAMAKQSPATMSCTGVAICWWWIMSLLAKTLHRPAIRGGSWDFSASSPNSPSMESPSRTACWSRKLPVPAAQMVFIAKSASREAAPPAAPPPFMRISLASSPPISMTLRASGTSRATAADWATISFTNTPPSRSAASAPPVPVVATRPIEPAGCRSSTAATSAASTWNGLPWHQA